MRIVYFICALLLTVCSYAQEKMALSDDAFPVESREYLITEKGYFPAVKSYVLYNPDLPEEEIVQGIKDWAKDFADYYKYYIHHYTKDGEKNTQVVLVATKEFYRSYPRLIDVEVGELIHYTDANLKVNIVNPEEKFRNDQQADKP